MKSRELKMGALILAICAIPFVGIELNRKLTLQRERMSPGYRHKRQLLRRFTSIKPKDGKALMIPAPSLKGLCVNIDFYTLSLPKNQYWMKPMLVGPGFKFGYYNGAKSYEYKILEVHEQGLRMNYHESGMPPGGPEIWDLPWK